MQPYVGSRRCLGVGNTVVLMNCKRYLSSRIHALELVKALYAILNGKPLQSDTVTPFWEAFQIRFDTKQVALL